MWCANKGSTQTAIVCYSHQHTAASVVDCHIIQTCNSLATMKLQATILAVLCLQLVAIAEAGVIHSNSYWRQLKNRQKTNNARMQGIQINIPQ